jgi:RNA polymerase sigma factor (TIGR02999 family)
LCNPREKPIIGGASVGAELVLKFRDVANSGDVTRLLLAWSGGDQGALDALVPLLYAELRRVAAAHLRRERSDHTLQTTALVHEAYLRLVDQTRVSGHSRAQFFAIAANLMRQILITHARRRNAAKRGGGHKVSLDEATVVSARSGLDLLALDQALTSLSHLDPRQSRIVELRFFAGMTEEEIADVLGISTVTVQREWRVARTVLHHHLEHGGFP